MGSSADWETSTRTAWTKEQIMNFILEEASSVQHVSMESTIEFVVCEAWLACKSLCWANNLATSPKIWFGKVYIKRCSYICR